MVRFIYFPKSFSIINQEKLEIFKCLTRGVEVTRNIGFSHYLRFPISGEFTIFPVKSRGNKNSGK